MSFVSQAKESRISTRRGSSSLIAVSQTLKPSTKADEISVRIAVSVLGRIGLDIGGRADVLYDSGSDRWMVKSSDEGFTVTGKKGAPTGLIRYTLKEGHARITNDRDGLPVRIECDDSSLEYGEDHVIFKLKNKGIA